MGNDNKATFLQATQQEEDFLRRLAYGSEASWGYDKKFMDKFDQEFNIDAAFIKKNPVYMAVSHKKIIAFWGLKQEGECWVLEYFYIDAGYMGKGYGKRMWSHLIEWCRGHGIPGIHFVTSPQAAGFYEKMGAIQDKEAVSVIDGRAIPHFLYSIGPG
ncbi:MAG: GNAT family N-acetyltransferase [Lachnospiraceae bacterium]|jgi:N-acetylglutamate synthase and related acetyltransferases|nr:GNAT family N-acetyltransferase [Lachnospiraceae bacterium]MCI9184568.1 GNAT family N-acetyltransferase [Lachnospiraceae bacterium]